MKMSVKMSVMILLLCLVCTSCSHEFVDVTDLVSDIPQVNGVLASDKNHPEGERIQEGTVAAGDYIITDFSVCAEIKEGGLVTREERAAALEQVRRYIGIGINATAAANVSVSQPFALLNHGSAGRTVFVFQGEKCIGIVAISQSYGEFVSSFTPLESENIEKCLKEKTPLVLITDGMRLWGVTEANSFPLNLTESAGDGMKWMAEYELYQEAITLTTLMP